MWRLSGFADEAAWTLAGQARLAASAGLGAVELRLAGGRPVVRWGERTVTRAVDVLARAGLGASCVATGIGKVPTSTHQARLVADLRRAMAIAHRVGTPAVRVFSFTVASGKGMTPEKTSVRLSASSIRTRTPPAGLRRATSPCAKRPRCRGTSSVGPRAICEP